jgi:hypothetical protein
VRAGDRYSRYQSLFGSCTKTDQDELLGVWNGLNWLEWECSAAIWRTRYWARRGISEQLLKKSSLPWGYYYNDDDGITTTTTWRDIKYVAMDRKESRSRRCRLRLKCDGTRAETRFRLLAKRTSPFKSAGASVRSTTGSRGVRISGSNAGYTMFRGIVKGTGYPLHSSVSTSLPLSCVTVCHHISTGLYFVLHSARLNATWTIYSVS